MMGELVNFRLCAQILRQIFTRPLHNQHELRWKVPYDGEMEQHIGNSNQIFKECKPTES